MTWNNRCCNCSKLWIILSEKSESLRNKSLMSEKRMNICTELKNEWSGWLKIMKDWKLSFGTRREICASSRIKWTKSMANWNRLSLRIEKCKKSLMRRITIWRVEKDLEVRFNRNWRIQRRDFTKCMLKSKISKLNWELLLLSLMKCILNKISWRRISEIPNRKNRKLTLPCKECGISKWSKHS